MSTDASETPTAPSNHDAIRRLHDTSGLTWRQVGQLFGLSANRPIAWATGQPMATTHAQRLAILLEVIDQLPADPADRRDALLNSPSGGPSLFQRLVAELYASRGPNLQSTIAAWSLGLGVSPDDNTE